MYLQFDIPVICHSELNNALVTRTWNKIRPVSKLFPPSSTSDWNNFISARGNVPEIILKLFQKLIAAHEYIATCSVSLK